MSTILYCPSCGRSNASGENEVETVKYQGSIWCVNCATIKKLQSGEAYVSLPSPGRMSKEESNILTTWQDCYSITPKKKILKDKAKEEIRRAWDNWDGDKSEDMSMFFFYGWLTKHRPYFLTFRDSGDRWQTVHSWLIRHESLKGKSK